jgi:hypothetical protein
MMGVVFPAADGRIIGMNLCEINVYNASFIDDPHLE